MRFIERGSEDSLTMLLLVIAAILIGMFLLVALPVDESGEALAQPEPITW